MAETTYVCGYVIQFTDGEQAVRDLHHGTWAECDEVLRNLPAIAYSGDKPVANAYTVMVPITSDTGGPT